MNTYNVEQLLMIDGPYGKEGRWYICRQIDAATLAEAKRIAFPDGVPEGYRVVLI